ncbi:MAG TPA: signal peptidase I [Anaerolineales bacterium]|nr:signal peptidase I [Anaerolineales bacterium]
MKQSQRRPSIFINLILFAGLVVIWIAFAPAKLGGRSSYVMVNGISMEPNYHTGDLVIVHKVPTYQVGDVVTYRDAILGEYIIHRIIAVEQDKYVFKGDNNSWIDVYRPTQEEIVGKQWIYIPKLGKIFEWMRVPLHLALIIVLLGGVLMKSMIKSKKQGKQNRPSEGFGGMLEGGLYLFGICTLIFLGLAVFAFIRPSTRPADMIKYQQESHFSYSATGTPVLYDTTMVQSGEPVFPKLACFLNVDFTYSVSGNQLQGVSGAHQLVARVMDEQSGWQRTIPITQPTSFNGNMFTSTSTVDLCQVIALVNTLEQETGLRANTYTLEIIPQVKMTAIAAGTQINDSFDPKLVFRFDEVHFFLTSPKGQDDPLNFSQQSSAQNPNVVASTISILGWEPTVSKVRTIVLFGLGVSMIGLVLLGLQAYATAQYSQEAWIQLRYSSLLVNVYERDIQPASTLIDVTTIDELAKLAERHNTVILHMTLNFLHCYLVQGNGVTYRFVFSAGKRNSPEIIAQPRREIVNFTPVKIVETQPADDTRDRYVVNNNHNDYDYGYAEPIETVVMRKIKL